MTIVCWFEAVVDPPLAHVPEDIVNVAMVVPASPTTVTVGDARVTTPPPDHWTWKTMLLRVSPPPADAIETLYQLFVPFWASLI